MLHVDNITAGYGMIKALKGVSLKVNEGEVTCLLGPNGAGKTTLIFTIAGIIKAQTGVILLNQNKITNSSPKNIVKNGIAVVPENRLVFPLMSVRENLVAGSFSQNKSQKLNLKDDLNQMFLRFPVLKERSEQLAGTLSGGEQQMLAVARALMSKPKLLLMDEPSVGLAPLIVAQIFQIILEMKKDGITIFLVEQNANMALKVADKFYLLEQGKITYEGIPGKIEDERIIQKAYLGKKNH